MAFQGFAREEQFSTNQIRIDINSVIENDLAEANRQNKYLGRNAELEGQWGNVYLNKLMEKHERESRNRRENFKFFMDNRAQIQEQIKYNNEIKFQDAGINRHVEGLDSILGKGLLQLAVNLGGSAIKGAIARSGEAKAEAKAQEERTNIGSTKAIHAQANDTQRKMLSSGHFKAFHDSVETEKTRLIEEYRAAGDPGQGIIEAAHFGNMMKLTQVQRENIYFNPDKVALNYQEHSRNFKAEINGRLFTHADIIGGGVNKATENEFNRLKQEAYYEKIGYSKLGGQASGQVQDAIKSVDSGYSRQSYNSRVKTSHKSLAEAELSTAETKLVESNGDVVHMYQWLTNAIDPTSPANRVGVGNALIKLQEWAENGLLSKSMMQKLWTMPGYGNAPHSLAEQHTKNDGHGTTASRFWKAQMDRVDVEQMQSFQNHRAKYNFEGQRITVQANNGGIPKDVARNQLEFFRSDEGIQILSNMSKGTASEVMASLGRAAGIMPERAIISPGDEFVKKQFTDTELDQQAQGFIFDDKGQRVSLANYDKKFTGVTNSRVREAYKGWVSDLTDNIIRTRNIDPRSPELKGMVLEVLADPNHPAVIQLKDLLRAETRVPGTTGPEHIYPKPRFPGIEKSEGQGATGMMAEYNTGKANNPGNYGWEKLTVYNHEPYKNFMETVNAAIPLGSKHVQNVLSNPGTEVSQIIRDQHNGSAWQAYMNGREHGGTDYVDFKPLSGDDGLDFNEVDQMRDQWGAQYMNLNRQAQAQIAAYGPTLNAAASNVIRTGSSGMGTGPHLDYGATDAQGKEVDPIRYIDNLYVGDRPLKEVYPETSGYGWRTHPVLGGRKWHAGRDIGTPTGTEVTVRGGTPMGPVHWRQGYGWSQQFRMEDGGTFWASHLDPPNKLGTPVTYGDTSVTDSSGNKFTLGSVTEGRADENPYDPLTQTVQWLAWKQKEVTNND